MQTKIIHEYLKQTYDLKKNLIFFFWQNEEELYVDKMHKTVWFREQLSPSIYRACLSLIQYIIPWDRKWYKNVQIL